MNNNRIMLMYNMGRHFLGVLKTNTEYQQFIYKQTLSGYISRINF